MEESDEAGPREGELGEEVGEEPPVSAAGRGKSQSKARGRSQGLAVGRGRS